MAHVRHTIGDMTTQTHHGRIPQLTLGWRMKLSLGDVSAQEMGEYLGVSRQTLSRWMGDVGTPPKRAYLAQWALKTGVDAEWLMTGADPTSAPDPDGGLRATPAASLEALTRAKRARTGRDGVSTGR